MAATRRRRQEYISPEQVITSAGSLTLAHGLSSTPKIIQAELICKVTEYGYSVGDKYNIPLGAMDNSNSLGLIAVNDSINIYIKMGSGSPVFYILNKITGTIQTLTHSNWGLIVRAYT